MSVPAALLQDREKIVRTDVCALRRKPRSDTGARSLERRTGNDLTPVSRRARFFGWRKEKRSRKEMMAKSSTGLPWCSMVVPASACSAKARADGW